MDERVGVGWGNEVRKMKLSEWPGELNSVKRHYMDSLISFETPFKQKQSKEMLQIRINWISCIQMAPVMLCMSMIRSDNICSRTESNE